jgi:hypothetical protein
MARLESPGEFPMSGSFCRLKTVRLGAALAALLVATFPGRVFAQKFDSVSLPIPVIVDARVVHCPLYLKLEMKRYDMPFDKFAAGPTNGAQAMFVTAVQAIRKRDAAQFASVWTSPDQMKRLDHNTTVTLVDNTPASWIDAARSNFDFDHLNVVAEVLVGSETMFVWESSTKSGIQRDAFYVGSDRMNRSRLSIVSSNDPVLALIKMSFDAAGTANGQASPADVALPYRYRIPLAGNGDPGPHPVTLEFDGTPMDFPVGDEKVKPPTPLLAFMRKAARDLQDGKYDSFATDYSSRSRERVKQWFASMQSRNPAAHPPQPAAEMSRAAAGMLSVIESNVKFVLDAAPVYLVFQSRAPGNSWTPDSLSFSYIVREGCTYRIANFSSVDDLEEFLQNPALFDKTILKSSPRARPPATGTPDLR